MQWLLTHFRNTFLAGALAAVPLIAVAYGIWFLENSTHFLADFLGVKVPGLGVLIALVAVYALGLFVTSVLGRYALSWLDYALLRVPGLKFLYQAWKDVLIVPRGKGEIFNQVVLVPMPGNVGQIGFTSGETLTGDPRAITVFLPNCPNPMFGRLVVVERATCIVLDVPVVDAFKHLLSSGNFTPAGLRACEQVGLQKEGG
jgi:uncharacterized membrane protein